MEDEASWVSYGLLMLMMRWCFLFLSLTVAICGAEKLSFNRDIRPILSERCYHCHGFDPKTRKADLRLDERQAVIDFGALVPGKPEASSIIQRIESHDADEQMPPPKSKVPGVTPAELVKLKQWIREGAVYEGHWSFIPVKPVAAGAGIDKLVDQKLAELKLQRQPQASAETLLRRLSFDLTGLPPSPAAVRGFTLDKYERVVDELLASTQYGERMAVDWLDLARYSDSYGFQVDREREMWPWRDWVVNAFNANLPYDQFVTWQIAGDMLPDATDEQRLATAFCRLHQMESEGGSVEEEYRVESVADRVQTFATAFLGLTFECCRCHDHKYDPISQRDYYGLFAMFQNIDEAGLYSYFTPSPVTPALPLMQADAKLKLVGLQQAVAALEKRLAEQRMEDETVPAALAAYSFDAFSSGRQLPNSVPLSAELEKALQPKSNAPASEKRAVSKDLGAGSLKGENELAEGKVGKAIRFTGDDSVDLPVGTFSRQDAFSLSLWLRPAVRAERAVVLHHSRAWTDSASRGYELLLENGRLKWSLIHFWPGNAISIQTQQELPLNGWTHVTLTYDGSSRAAGLKLYVNGQPAGCDTVRDALTKEISAGVQGIALGERFRDRGFKGGMVDELRIYAAELSPAAARAVFDPSQCPAMRPASAETVKLRAELKAARAALYAHQDAQKDLMVMQELPEPKKAYILTRGEYDKRAAEVTAQTPKVLGLLPEDAPKNRLSLARWLTSAQHPLFARVTVNRLWNQLLGRGLVKTVEDLGSQGEPPLHGELLDYLAARFMASGWNMKALVKEIVMSQTYQQRSVAEARVMADDPENQWLARGPRHRLPAEMIRDNALSAAGLLKLSLGGPPVNAYEMTEAFKPASISGGDGVYRRSLYSGWRRTSPPPAMTTFDAPKRSVCTAKRDRTDSPLQALVLLNGTQYVEAARVLGQSLHVETEGHAQRMIQQGFLRCLSRLPDEKEQGIALRLYEEQLAWFSSQPQEAEALLKMGNAKLDAKLSPAQAAAATVLGQLLLNHDACVVKR